jgi:hypothetical protein
MPWLAPPTPRRAARLSHRRRRRPAWPQLDGSESGGSDGSDGVGAPLERVRPGGAVVGLRGEASRRECAISRTVVREKNPIGEPIRASALSRGCVARACRRCSRAMLRCATRSLVRSM